MIEKVSFSAVENQEISGEPASSMDVGEINVARNSQAPSRAIHTPTMTPKGPALPVLAGQAIILEDLVRGLPEKLGPESGYSRGLLAYLASLGDPDKSARVTGIPIEKIREWAERDSWNDKITSLLLVRRVKGQTAFAVELNRLLNLSQAVRLRGIIEEVLSRIVSTESSLMDWLSVETARGKGRSVRNVTAKPLLDLSKALLTVQQATYMALADQAAERIGERKAADAGEVGEIQNPHLEILRTLTQLQTRPAPPLAGATPIPDAITKE